MRRFWIAAAACLVLSGLGVSAALAQPAAAPPVPTPSPAVAPPTSNAVPAAPDYRQEADWLCHGDALGACAVDLNTLAITQEGQRTAQPFQAAAEPAIDCFYVYPTVSADPTPLSDLTPGPEERRVVRAQFARLASQCRLFAPMYRQISMAGLSSALSTGREGAVSFDAPYQDVLAAWRDYMEHDNHGRGVVVIGHSQGAILLARLLREEIDGHPAQRLLVGAYLAGHPGFGVPQGRDAGGALPTIPVCRRAHQAGCVFVWSTYLASDTANPRFFGRVRESGLTAACASPAAPAGGSAILHGYFSRPSYAPETDPPFVENLSGITGECVSDEQGAVLRVTITPDTAMAPILTAGLQRANATPGWGMHPIDMNLVMGDIEASIARQAATWGEGRRQ